MSFSLRNRIAVFYMIATAVITLLLFFVIYWVVHKTAYDSIDDRLTFEANDVLDDVAMERDTIFFTDSSEWTEQEHKAVEVYPTFIEVTDLLGKVIRKTSNLKNEDLKISPQVRLIDNINTSLSDKPIRQKQVAILNGGGKVMGFLAVAMPLEGAELVVENLRQTLMFSYPAVLLVLFLVTRVIAGKSIKPLQIVTKEAENISNDTLSNRIKLPKDKDEIFKLTETINSLMDRLEDAVLREKQFTSDASHELRTPLSVVKGTLEVLIRKPREIKLYEEKISYCIKEVDRISGLIDQLLILARYESGNVVPVIREIDLVNSVNYTILRLKEFATEHGISISFDEKRSIGVKADNSMLEIMLENILSNSIKYSGESKNIDINIQKLDSIVTLTIKDFGIGMKPEQLARIFDRFYRSEEARNSQIGGHGIGLAIVKRLADVQNLILSFESESLKGTTTTIKFPA